ncbi:unnamed protein product [Amaranthus hypochondriacus]
MLPMVSWDVLMLLFSKASVHNAVVSFDLNRCLSWLLGCWELVVLPSVSMIARSAVVVFCLVGACLMLFDDVTAMLLPPSSWMLLHVMG